METIDLLVQNATIVTMSRDREILRDASMAVQDGRILALGPTEDLGSRYQGRQVLNARGKVVFPGLINTHNHFFQVLLKGLGKDRGLLAWLDASVQRAYRHITEEDIYLATAVGAMEMLRTGVTTVLDYQYAHGRAGLSDAVIRAMEDTGIRGILGRGYTDTKDYPPERRCDVEESEDDYFSEVIRLDRKVRDSSRVSVALAPGIVWALSEDGFRRCVEVARDLDTFITIHTIETLEDNQYSQDKYGLSTLEFFEKAGILSAPFLAVHCAEITPEEIGLLARHDVRVSYNAISNMMMGYKTLPLRELLDAGITVGLATDGAASNDNQNMLQVLKISPLWQKAFYQDPAVIPASRVLEMATIEGARAVFRDHEIGSLEPGKMADFFVYNPAHANSAPMVDPVVNLVYSADSCNVETTVVGGEIVYGDGKIIRVREKDLVGQIQENALRLWEQAGLFNEQWNRRVVAEPFRQPR